MSIQSLAVFCGSKTGTNNIFATHAVELGKLLAEKNVKLIYGGGSAGIMGVIADSTMQHGGQVMGFIPKLLLEWEVQHRGITELIICDDMHERKKKIYAICDAAVILPGGFGTLDELFEILTWNQLTIHDKRIFILNSGGFYDHLISHIEHMRKEQFLYEHADKSIMILDEPHQLLEYL
ncbi:MAG TPA: TIGR00730 family Rossman fold protein [Chitinophagaceae bacterium]|nr:TIGR00730 family Rossman fold protein [Chitinophagaceae bacterium]